MRTIISTAVLNRVVVIVLLVAGPALTVAFWFSVTIDSWPYQKSDLVNGVAAVSAAILFTLLAAKVFVLLRHGGHASYVNLLSAVVLALSAIYCGGFGASYLIAGPSCSDEYCWYGVGQVLWWFLALVHWCALVVLAAIAIYVKVRVRSRSAGE